MIIVFTDLARQSLASLRFLLLLTLILGVGYPASLWLVAQPFGDRAAGQPVRLDGEVVGSTLIGQQFEGAQWFHSRPSPNGYDTLASAPSNLGPRNPDLIAAIEERRAAVAAAERVDPGRVPPDALTASGSGLDPQISPAYAGLQAARVARVNGLAVSVVDNLIEEHTQGRFLGFHGEPGVNVLELNLSVLDVTRQ